MKSREILTVGLFALSLLVLMIGAMLGSRASPPLSAGATPLVGMPAAGAEAPVPPAATAHQGGAQGRRGYHPPAP